MSDVQTTDSAETREFDTLLRDSLRRAIRISRLSPAQIADELSRRTQRPIKGGSVYAWMAPTKQKWHLPADVVPHLCEILGDDSIQRVLLSDKLKDALSLGESARRVVSLLRRALPQPRERRELKGRKKTRHGRNKVKGK
jgi:hypothetical protein